MKAHPAGAGQGGFYAYEKPWQDCPHCAGSGKVQVELTYPPGCCQWCGSPAMRTALLAWMERLKEDADARLECPDCGFVYAPSKFSPKD